MNQQRAIRARRASVVLAVVIIIGAIGLAIFTAHPGVSTPTVSLTSLPPSSTSYASSTSSAIYQVIRSNLTLQGQTAAVPCADLGMICPPAINASLSQVELIKYGSTYFYSHNQTAPVGEPGVQPTYDVWFTNSTVFCVSPAYPQNPTCPTHPYRQTSITMSSLSASTMDSSNGLRLSLSLSTNASGKLTATVAELNTLDVSNNVTLAHNWPVKTELNMFLWTQAWCAGLSPSMGTFGFEILQGNYRENNYTEGTALFLLAQAGIQCPAYLSPPNYLAFAPHQAISSSGTSSGFWMGERGPYWGYSCPDPSQNPNPRDYCPLTFFPFSPGTYTVVAGDEWGQAVMLHFTVED